MYGTILRRFGQTGLPSKTVVLTFDDGPVSDGLTEALLDLLSEHGVIAAFCLVGKRIIGAESIIRKIHEDGHLIVNHGDEHKVPNMMSDETWRADVEDCDRAIGTALRMENWQSQWYRPPGGGWNRRLARLIGEKKKTLMPITFFAWDTLRFPNQKKLSVGMMMRSLRKQQGGVFLLHEAVLPLLGGVDRAITRSDRLWILDVVRAFVVQARSEGFSFIDPRQVRDVDTI